MEEASSAPALNDILHEYGRFIIGRMGIPYPKRSISIISIAIDAPPNEINTLCGRIGRLKGVTSKTNYSNIFSDDDEEKAE